MTFTVLYHPAIQKKVFELSSFVLQGFRANVKIQIEGNDYEKPFVLENLTRLFDLVQTMKDGIAKEKAIAMLMERFMHINKDPQKDKFMQLLYEGIESEQNNEAEQMAMQLQAGQAQADISLKQAQAAEEQSRADKQQLENVATGAMLDTASQI